MRKQYICVSNTLASLTNLLASLAFALDNDSAALVVAMAAFVSACLISQLYYYEHLVLQPYC
jgi:hypothetical protein